MPSKNGFIYDKETQLANITHVETVIQRKFQLLHQFFAVLKHDSAAYPRLHLATKQAKSSKIRNTHRKHIFVYGVI